MEYTGMNNLIKVKILLNYMVNMFILFFLRSLFSL